MKVAVVHSFYDRAQASGENEVVLAQVQRLREAGVTVELIAIYTDEQKSSRGYPVRAALGAANLAGLSPEGQLEAFQPDVIHVHNLFPNWNTQWLDRWGHKTVVTLHNYRTVCSNALMWRDGKDCRDCLDKGTTSAMKNKCYRDSALATLPLAFASRDRGAHQPVLQHARQLVVLNSGAEKLFSSLSPARVTTVPNFTARRSYVQKDVLSGDSGRWLYVGRVTPEKGVARLVEQLPSHVSLDIVGIGPDLPAVEAAIARSAADVRLLGPKGHDEVLELMEKAVGLVIPSLWSEGIPTTALEALSCGTPVLVASPVASSADLTADGAGLVYDPSIPNALGRAMEMMASTRADFSTAAVQLHARRFSPEAWTKFILDIYLAVANDSLDEPKGQTMSTGQVNHATAAAAREAAEQWRHPWGDESLKDVLASDYRANPRDPGSLLLMTNLRAAQYLISRFGRRSPVAMAGIAIARGINEGLLGVELRPATKVAPGLSVYHRFGIVVNNEAIIGRNVQIRHGVTIGHKMVGQPSPVICDGVEIGAGAIIVGDIVIGENAKVAAGSVVVKDVPPGAVVAGNPARVING